MCGIAGFFSFSGKYTRPDLEAMTGILAHRGPDADGFFCEDNIGLGHRRLSILDLSERGNQPMISHNQNYVMVYNGEVYNFQELSNELKLEREREYQLSFNSSSDSEVILEAFSTWGPQFVHKLNGMFSIAIYDRRKKELFLFRDRIGIKPVYYSWDGKDFLFGSEIKALMAPNKLSRAVDHRSVSYFLNLGFIPGSNSIFSSIKKLQAGSFLKVNASGIQWQKYWSVKTSLTEDKISNEKEALIKLSDLLISSVQYQLKSDLPFGVFLSGGIDSSLITAQAAQLSASKINTFSIGFEENRYNESVYAREVAKHLKTNHFEFIVSYKDAINLIEAMFDTYSEPFADSSAIPTMLVSRLAKEHVTVTLSGEGGDELFFGYGSYIWANRLSSFPVDLFHNSIHSLLKRSSNNRFRRAASLFNYNSKKELPVHIFSQEQYLFSFSELKDLLVIKPEQFDYEFEPESKERRLSAMEQQALFDLQYYLPDDLLTKVDRASMRYSLETRVPYLDHRIVEFALNLDEKLKYKNGVSKYILKEILYQYIPKSLFDRPKQGFAIPLQQWLKKELRFLIEDHLNQKSVEEAGIVNYAKVKEIKDRFFAGEDYLYNRLWQLIVLHRWMLKNILLPQTPQVQ